jgi:hypothetical protein
MTTKAPLREKMRRGLRKKTLSSIRSTALDGIRGVNARLHSIVLSAGEEYRDEYDVNYLKEALKNPWFDENFIPEDRGCTYKAKFIKQSKNFQINLFVGRMGYQPYFQIEIHHKTDNNPKNLKNLLIEIDNKIPGIRVSKVEYTIDQCCYEPHDVANLFLVERFSLYDPDQKGKVQQLEGGESSHDGSSRNSLIWHLGDKNKIYERGDDKKKKKKTWDYYDFNRVRLEHSADRRELFGNSIDTLKDLINGPKFYETYCNYWNFRRFKDSNSKIRIMEWEKAALPFQYLIRNTKLVNPSQYTEMVDELASLQEKINNAMKVFDKEWAIGPTV